MTNQPRTSDKTITFKEYYPLYVAAHKHPATKLLHFAGQFLTIAYIWFIIALSVKVSWLLLGYLWFTPNVIYILAWPSHWWIEKNQPLAFTNKKLAKLSDLVMFWDVLIARKIPLDGRDKTASSAVK